MKKIVYWIKGQDNIELFKKLNYIGVPLQLIFVIIISFAISEVHILLLIVTLIINVVLTILLYGVPLFINLRK